MRCFSLSQLLLLFIAACLPSVSLAIDLGTYGNTQKIIEQDLLEHFDAKLKYLQSQGKLHEYQQKFAMQAQKRAMTPKPVAGVVDTIKAREFIFDPTYVAPQDYRDHQNNIIVAKGAKSNPLETIKIQPMIFFNGDNQAQSDWALEQYKKHAGKIKLILTKGKPLEKIQQWNIKVYFDQHGFLSSRFGITQVPAFVKQQDAVLHIIELKLGETSD